MLFTPYILSGLAAVGLVQAATLTAPQKRTFVDVCAAVDADLKVLGLVIAHIDVCLCIGALPAFIQANANVKSAVSIFGSTLVSEALKALINLNPKHTSCTYPDNSTPACSANCGWSCKPPYVKSGNKCVLPPSYRKRALTETDAAVCPWGLQKCGVSSSASSRVGFECLDTQQNLESCGGCTVPFGLSSSTKPDGVDCTSIDGVSDVGCVAGACVVHKCRAGWLLSEDGEGCVKVGYGFGFGEGSTLAEQTVW